MPVNDLQAKELEYAHLGLDLSKVDFNKLRDPFARYYSREQYIEVLKLIREPKNFFFTCKYILNVEPTLFQLAWLNILWEYPFPMIIANRGASKTFTTALYYCLRSTITQGSKIVITSASFRQAKMVFEYIETIWKNAPVWRDLVGGDGPKRGVDKWDIKIGKSSIIAIPLGTGEKIRGLRANYVDVEEFSSVSPEIYEIVLRGFTATSNNPVENIKNKAKIKKLQELNLWTPEMQDKILGSVKPNQILLSGTASWDFQHFAKYWKQYKQIIESKGDLEKIKEAIGSYPEKGFDWRHYCIIRIPVDLLPDGMMDETAIANAKATMDPARYNLEFGAVFAKDSNGFFPRSLIEACTCKQPITIGNDSIKFSQKIRGDFNRKYILSIDPASESDNLAITILENHSNHNRVVYCWTAVRKDLLKRFKGGEINENNFYAFIARKVRNLMKAFDIQYIALDTQGGGIAVMEALHDLKRLEPGELPIWPLRQDDPMFYPGTKDYGYDDEAGLHIIEMVNMSNAAYTVEANHGLRKDLMNKTLLFPYADAVVLECAEIYDDSKDIMADTLQECVLEIEELKEELSTITHTNTQNGRDRWDTPVVIGAAGKKIRQRKDRYSSLMMGNMLARRLFRTTTIDYSSKGIGGFATEFKGQEINGSLYSGQDEFVKWANSSLLGMGVTRQSNNNPFGYYNR